MRKIYIALISILILSACRQQESELTSAAITAQPAAQDTLQDTIAAAPETPPLPSCQTEAPLLLPPDTATTDAGLVKYLQQLEQAVQTQNAEQLQELVDPNIRTGFDENGGWSSFAGQWQPDNPSSEVWLLLQHLLQLGGGYPVENNRQVYALPYVYSNWPDSIDAFMHVAVIRTGAILREEPVANAPAVCTLNQVILKVDYGKSYPEGAPQKEWWHVQSADAQLQGYLHRSDVHSPVGYRAIFNKNKKGNWRMTALVAGD
ncbi:hypothetical protein [Pontibacter flavimaris]|uniref:SH3 domain-containing protein n=1 Tax=Pontibacter flavimaris TaxID=1797110 RepID=A0A1Q5PI90_9BACT|nr:hypothetical protein [Pontibacter flavimaris]OKL41934.1 hypothetical protein A3841_07965 [Pontibacter flavimaris]